MLELKGEEKSGIGEKAFSIMTEIRRDIGEDIRHGHADIDDLVEHSILTKALNGDLKAQAFWLSNRMPDLWREECRNRPYLAKFSR